MKSKTKPKTETRKLTDEEREWFEAKALDLIKTLKVCPECAIRFAYTFCTPQESREVMIEAFRRGFAPDAKPAKP
jgi:hypothetical protein